MLIAAYLSFIWGDDGFVGEVSRHNVLGTEDTDCDFGALAAAPFLRLYASYARQFGSRFRRN